MDRFWLKQVVFAMGLILLVVLLGGVALWLVSHGDFSISQTLYFTLITVSTVGFSELPELSQYPGGRLVVVLLILGGVGTMAFFNSVLTAILVEGTLGKAFRRKRMHKKLTKMNGHVVVAGCGRTGRFCVQELQAMGMPFVVIDKRAEMLERLNEEVYAGGLAYVVGDATEDHDLQEAGVERASGLIAALTEDRDNVFVVLSARTLNSDLHIVAKSLSVESDPKLLKAGADKLVSPHRIGGVRLVSELVRPRTMEFLDAVQTITQSDFHLEDVELSPDSPLAGLTLRTAPIRKQANALVVAIRKDDGTFLHNPPPDEVLRAGMHLIVVGDQEGVSLLRTMASAGARP